MKILWLHQYFATPKGWGAVRTYEFARRFCSAGHTVDVVCCAGYDASLTTTGASPVLVEGVRVFVSGTGYRPHMGFARRLLSFLQFMFYALWHVLRRGGEYDVVVASSGPLTLAVPALIGRWLRRLPFVFEVIDVWPDSAIAAGVLKNPVLKWVSFKLEELAYRHATVIVTCSTGMTERVEKKLGSEERRVVTISNCCDLEPFTADEERRKVLRDRWGVRNGQMVVLYTGAMGLSNAVEDLVDAVKGTAADERIIWWFAGDGALAGKLKMAVGGAEAITSRVRWFGCLPKAQVVELYMAANVNVVTFMHEPLFYENSPNKFFDGIAAGLPTVFNRSTWLEPWLKAYDCGIVCTGDDAGAEMARELKFLAADETRRQNMGQGSRRLAEEVFSRDRLAVDFLAIVEKAGGRSG